MSCQQQHYNFNYLPPLPRTQTPDRYRTSLSWSHPYPFSPHLSNDTPPTMASNPTMDLDPKYDHYDFPTTSPEPKPGHPGHTTKEQDAAVHQLRMTLEQEGYTKRLDTLTMLRFLRARKFNVQMAKDM